MIDTETGKPGFGLSGILKEMMKEAVVLDTETTGLGDSDQITQTGAVKFSVFDVIANRLGDQVPAEDMARLQRQFPSPDDVSTWTSLNFFCMPRNITGLAPEVEELTGISFSELTEKTRASQANRSDPFMRFSDYAEELATFVEGRIVIAHNAEFDVGMINREYARLPENHPRRGFRIDKSAHVIDSLRIARILWPNKSGRLDAVATRCGVDLGERQDRHGALIDAMLLGKVFRKMLDQMLKSASLNMSRAVRASTVGKMANSREYAVKKIEFEGSLPSVAPF